MWRREWGVAQGRGVAQGSGVWHRGVGCGIGEWGVA